VTRLSYGKDEIAVRCVSLFAGDVSAEKHEVRGEERESDVQSGHPESAEYGGPICGHAQEPMPCFELGAEQIGSDGFRSGQDAQSAAWYTSPPGTRLGLRVESRLRVAGGRVVRLSEGAPMLQDTVVATEDERFNRHRGIDVIGLLRAVPYDVVHLSFAQGASTITEQVAKLFYLNGNDHSPWRKLEDAAVAVKLENRYSKEEILSAYLNGVYFGNGAYGVGAASESYFGVTPRKLEPLRRRCSPG
jgi:Transglycosylase